MQLRCRPEATARTNDCYWPILLQNSVEVGCEA
jgi:hypothetical protein